VAKVFLPRDVKTPFIRECRLYGADVTLVDGVITDAARAATEAGSSLGWYDVSTLKEPYRIEGKKTMAYELAEQMEWEWPDWIVYPTGGGDRHGGNVEGLRRDRASGMGASRPAAADGLGAGDRLRAHRPRLRAWREERAPWENPRPSRRASRPRAIGDFLILRAVRDSGGTAIAVSDAAMIDGMLELGSTEGISAAPEGGAPWRRFERSWLTARFARAIASCSSTRRALKYLDALPST
jgi:threonine synthase